MLQYHGPSESGTDLVQSWTWRYRWTQGVWVRRGGGQRPEKQLDTGQGDKQTPSGKQDGLVLLGETRWRHVGRSSVQQQRWRQAQRLETGTGTGTGIEMEVEVEVVHQQRAPEKLCQGWALTMGALVATGYEPQWLNTAGSALSVVPCHRQRPGLHTALLPMMSTVLCLH
jgi:hypothetical protein